MRSLGLFFLLLFPVILPAQKKALELDDVQRWKKISDTRITPDGNWVAYLLAPTTEGDNVLCLWNAKTRQTIRFERAVSPNFTYDSRYLVFQVKPHLDTLKAQRRRKVKKDDLPKDSLAIYSLTTGQMETIPDVQSYALPEKWAGWMAYQLEPVKPPKEKKAAPDSTRAEKPAEQEKDKKKVKKEDAKENGSRLVLRQLGSEATDTIYFVREYRFAKRGDNMLAYSTGRDSSFPAGVYRFTCADRQLKPLFQFEKGKFAQLALDDWGRQTAFLADTDTSKARIRPWQLCYWTDSLDQAIVLADTGSVFLSDERTGWNISEHARPVFSEDGEKLYFGIAPQLPLPDTSLLSEEIVNVEVWAWNSNRLYTELENSLSTDKKRSYPVVYHIDGNKFVPLGDPDLPDWRFQEQREAGLALAYTDEPYGLYRQWESYPRRDVYAVDLKTGIRQKIAENLPCSPSLSPDAHFILWWSYPDTAWFAWSAGPNKTRQLTFNQASCFFNTEHNTPSDPPAYGMAGWLNGDATLLIYDRYDIWQIDPTGKTEPRRLTQGREDHVRYRYIRLDPEERAIAPDARLLLHHFNEDTRDEGYAWLDLGSGIVSPWLDGAYSYTRRPLKAEKANKLVYDRQNYQTFPDLYYNTIPDRTKRMPPPEVRISDANPQTA
ncbi:MAG: hypothetical protein EP344_08090, partial [Bacteroidetes bacterium]